MSAKKALEQTKRHTNSIGAYILRNRTKLAVIASIIIAVAVVPVSFSLLAHKPSTAELSFVENSVLGKQAGSVVPASCDSLPPVDHFAGDCPSIEVCPSGQMPKSTWRCKLSQYYYDDGGDGFNYVDSGQQASSLTPDQANAWCAAVPGNSGYYPSIATPIYGTNVCPAVPTVNIHF